MYLPTVLCVDDEEPILRSLERVLRREPYRFLGANSAEEALSILRGEPVDIVVSDQRMPGQTGAQLLEQVRAQYPDVVRIMLSGYAEPDVILESVNSGGIFRFIAKPWEDNELKAALRQGLELSRVVLDNRRLTELAERQIRDLEQLNLKLREAVCHRTASLANAQDIIDKLPCPVLGLGADLALMVANDQARLRLPAFARAVPGDIVRELLPTEIRDAVDRTVASGKSTFCSTRWGPLEVRVHVAILGEPPEPRGCVLLVEV